MVGVGLVLSDAARFAQTPLSSGRRGEGNRLCFGQSSPPSSELSGRRQCSCYIPHCDTVCQYALDGAAVEVHQDLRGL